MKGEALALVIMPLAVVGCLLSCGGNNGGGGTQPPPAPTITSVSVSPASATVQVGLTQQFTVTVKGTGNFDSTVNLFVNGIMSGDNTVGAIDISGKYTAPSAVPNPSTVTIKACSRQTGYENICGTATVTVTAPPLPLPFLAYMRIGPSTACGAPCQDVWKVRLDQNGLATDLPIQLTTDPADGSQPSVSPDGTKIAFISNRDGDFAIYVMNSDGSSHERVPNGISWALYPAWSPDGKKIAFIGKFADSTVGIATMDADGSGVLQLTKDASCPSGGSCKYPGKPTWSPDGKEIAYNTITGTAVIINSADGTTIITLPISNSPGSLSWSPDGKWIALSITEDPTKPSEITLCLVHPDGSGFTQLVQPGGESTWSPDSSKIIFGRPGGLYVIKTDGSGLALVVGDSVSISGDPSWWGPH
jgi:TolB protein